MLTNGTKKNYRTFMRNFFSLNYIRNLLNSPTKKRLAENFLSLSFLQAVNYILPLITLPYLVRVLGPEKFGLLAFASAVIGYFVIFTDYGFNLSATREISINRKNENKISEIFSSVMAIKFFLGILSFIILLLILFFIPKFRNDWIVYLFTFGTVFGSILFPVWFFQAMEKMKYITFLNIFAKVIFTICIFIFIRKTSDYIYVPLIGSLGYLATGIISLWIIFRNFEVKLKLPTIKNVQYQLKEGWHIFISSGAISLYTLSNVFILGLLTNNIIVGYYSAAEKIIKAVQGLFSPMSQTAYPYISKLASESRQKALVFIKKMLIFVGSGSFIVSLLVFVFASPIVHIVLGSQYEKSIIVLRILAFLPFIIGLSNIFVVQGLYVFRFQQIVSKFVVAIAIFHLFLLVAFTYFYSFVGSAMAVVLTEIFITIFSIKYFYKFILKKKILWKL